MKSSQIIGHKEILNLLSGALENNKVSHAYLFGGPAGTGKATLARVFAGALLCLTPGEEGACGRCKSCRQFYSGNHPDFYHLVPEGSYIKISQVRSLHKQISLEPFQSNRQVFIIEEADKMTREAANSFLKNLEEPPGAVVFILVSDLPQSLLPTISSRCQQLNFKPLSSGEVMEGLKKHTGSKEEECRLAAALAGGSLGRALELIDNNVERDELFYLLDRLEKVTPGEICELAGKEAQKEVNWERFMDMLLMWYRDVLIWKKTGRRRYIINIDKLAELEKYKNNLHIHRIIWKMKTVEQAKKKISSHVNTRLVLEELFLAIAGAQREGGRYTCLQ